MTEEQPDAQMNDNHQYNCPNDSDHVGTSGPGNIDMLIPARLLEFGPSAGRALLRLLVEAHRKRITESEQTPEEI